MAAAAILNCHFVILGHPRRSVFIRVKLPFKFPFNRICTFQDMTISLFHKFCSKSLFRSQKFVFLVAVTPEDYFVFVRPPKGTSLRRITRFELLSAVVGPTVWAGGGEKSMNKSPAVSRISRPYSRFILATCVHNCPSMMFQTCCCLRPKCKRSYLLIYITSDTS